MILRTHQRNTMRGPKVLHLSLLSMLLFLSSTQSIALSRDSAIWSHELEKRVLYHDNIGTTRYFLNSFSSIGPWGLGSSPTSMAAVYTHAISILLQNWREQPQSSSFGFHLDHLSLTFATTTGDPIPWPSAVYFMQQMLRFLDRRLIGPEFQAYVTNVALDVTIEISLRLLLDGPLPGRHDK